MIFGKNKHNHTTALAVITPEQVREQPIQDLGAMLKSMLIKAEIEGAVELYVYVNIDRNG